MGNGDKGGKGKKSRVEEGKKKRIAKLTQKMLNKEGRAVTQVLEAPTSYKPAACSRLPTHSLTQ